MMSAQLAAASFLKLFRDGQNPARRAKYQNGRRADNISSWDRQTARQEQDQLYDPFQQHGTTRSPTVSFDGFAPLHTGLHSNELPSRRQPWRAFGSPQQWQQLPQRLAAGKDRIMHATAGELKRLPGQIRQRRRELLAEDRTDRGSRPAFRPTSKHVLNPLSNWVKYWDVWMGLQLIFTALVTPYQVAFLRPSVESLLFYANLLVDVSFAIDLGLQPFMGFWDEEHDICVMDLCVIRRKYLRGWAAVDAAAACPYDVIAVLAQDSCIGKLQFLRLLRLAKLTRVLRVQRFLRRWESWLPMNFSTLKLASFVALTFVCAHWMACGLYMITALEPHAQHTWLTEYNELAGHHEVKQHFQIYLVALYWSSMTMSTIGYGDVAPQTTIERVYVIGGIFLGASLYAYMVGAVCGIVAAMDPDESEFYGAMDTLNVFARRNKLPLKLQLRLREFARYQRVTRSLQDRPDLLDHMSENLSSEVAAHTQARWVRAVAAFAAMPPELAIEISLALGTRSFSPEEVIFHAGEPADTIFIVERGIVASRGHLLGPGGILGLSLYVMGTDNSGGGSTTSGTDRSRTWDHAGTTLTYANLLTLQRCHLASIMHRHPDAARALRQSVVRPLIQEGVLMFSRAARWVDAQRTAGAAVAQCVPHKAELGGDFVTDRRLHKVLGLLLERQPRLFRPLLEACIVIQSQWRGFKARRLAQHMRETIGRLALQRRVAKLSKRLRAAGFIYSTIPSSGPRKPTPSADAAAAVHTSRGVTLDTATSACVPQSCTGGASAAACSAWVNIREQVTSLATDVAAMHALLRRIAGPMAAAETAAAVVMAAE